MVMLVKREIRPESLYFDECYWFGPNASMADWYSRDTTRFSGGKYPSNWMFLALE
jgi:hypothetical protein